MLHRDRDGLICDLAETYGVIDMKALPTDTLAALACGLGPDSRTMRALTGRKLTLQEQLLAMLTDSVRMVLCALAGHEPLPSVYDTLTAAPDTAGSASAADFEAARAAWMKEG